MPLQRKKYYQSKNEQIHFKCEYQRKFFWSSGPKGVWWKIERLHNKDKIVSSSKALESLVEKHYNKEIKEKALKILNHSEKQKTIFLQKNSVLKDLKLSNFITNKIKFQKIHDDSSFCLKIRIDIYIEKFNHLHTEF